MDNVNLDDPDDPLPSWEDLGGIYPEDVDPRDVYLHKYLGESHIHYLNDPLGPDPEIIGQLFSLKKWKEIPTVEKEYLEELYDKYSRWDSEDLKNLLKELSIGSNPHLKKEYIRNIVIEKVFQTFRSRYPKSKIKEGHFNNRKYFTNSDINIDDVPF